MASRVVPVGISYQKFLDNAGDFADAKIFCKGETFKVHKAVLCAESKWFRVAFSKQHAFHESQSDSVTLEDFEPDDIKWLLSYVYGGKGPKINRTDFKICARLSYLGDYFQVEGLVEFAASKLQAICDRKYASAFVSLELEHGATGGYLETRGRDKDLSRNYLFAVLDGIREAYRVFVPLRGMLVDFIYVCRSLFFRCDDEWAQIFEETPQFAIDFAIICARGGSAGITKRFAS